uniref:Transposase n=1 Tax=Thermosporothrix sp. COM3 TaxID=2490863 RepID=A0A455SJ70_9CHLR|nr:transposase [Thermosporothrix sp. COM3]
MQLVEKHVIRKGDARYEAIDQAAFVSKNLYNAANYEIRQAFIFEGVYLNSNQMHHLMKTHPAYQALPRKVSQQVLRTLDKNWKSFFRAIAEWREHPEKFLGRPCLPKYKDKQQGRNLLIYTIQAISKPALRQGYIQPSGLPIRIKTNHQNVDQVRIIPRHGFYVVEVVYEQEPVQAAVDPQLFAGIDIGIDNLATLTSNKKGFVPRIVNGRPVKSINQFYNKRKAELDEKLMKMDARRRHSHRLERLTTKRTRRIHHSLHTASRRIVNLLVEEGIGTLVIGKNDGWKQEVEMGKRTNQQFVAIPHARFIEMLAYKAQLVGIRVIITEESYTSKCSFLDNEPIGKHETYAGKRVKRSLFRASDGRLLNADVNGSANIIRKVAPNAFADGVEAVVVRPVRFCA